MERISQLEALAEAISYAEICLISNHPYFYFYPVNIEELKLDSDFNYHWTKIQYFVILVKLDIHGNNSYLSNISQFKNKNLEILTLSSCGALSSFNGLSGFPRLHTLSVTNCARVSDLVFVLSSYNHCVKNINIESCRAINNTELMTYCQKNNIKLTLK